MLKHMFVVAFATMMLGTSCTNASNADYVSTENVSTQMVGDTSYAFFTFDCIEDVSWDENYYLDYCDPDCFDSDRYGYIVYIDIDDSIAEEFLNDYAKWSKADWETKYALDDKWEILETPNCIEIISNKHKMED